MPRTSPPEDIPLDTKNARTIYNKIHNLGISARPCKALRGIGGIGGDFRKEREQSIGLERKHHLPTGRVARPTRSPGDCDALNAACEGIQPNSMQPPALGRLMHPGGVDAVSRLAQLYNPRSRVDDIKKPHRLKRRNPCTCPHCLKQACALVCGGVIGPVVNDAVEGREIVHSKLK